MGGVSPIKWHYLLLKYCNQICFCGFRGYKKDSIEVYKSKKSQHGFIAQEVKAAIDAHPDIKDGFRMWDSRDDGSQEVSESAVIPILVKAIQELSAKVEELQTEIKTLKGN